MRNNWQCRYAPSLGDLEDTPENIWGTKSYEDIEAPTVFFGLYGVSDFYALWRHKGKKAILWTGSDIRHFLGGYFLDEKGRIKLQPQPLAKWINEKCENWVENAVEYEALKKAGIRSKICPSFLGKTDEYEITYYHNEKPKVYTSVSGNDFALYGWDKIDALARKHPEVEFHLYGNTVPWFSKSPNAVAHGRVPKEQMNAEIKNMQGALRLLPFEGFSEIIAKSVLWGQWPISEIDYPFMLKISEIELLKNKKEANVAGRIYYRKILNKYPWNIKK